MVGGHRVVGFQRNDEVGRNQPGALVDQLVVGVLAIGACATPDDRAGFTGQRFSVLGYTLAIAFHVQLLEMIRKAAQVLVIRQDGVGVGVVHRAQRAPSSST